MAEDKKLSAGEVRRTISTSLATAFGFVIGLLWNNVVVGGMNVAGVSTTMGTPTVMNWIVLLITALVITIVMIVLIIVISRWGNK